MATVVWIHGGAWLSGSKDGLIPYLRILAERGYTAVGVNYTIAPEATYPTAVNQLNDALAYLVEHAVELRIDPDRIVLAGDSAGAQLASQLAVLITNPDYARRLGITPALSPARLRATILHCGIYDLDAMADLEGIPAWGFKTALWSYTGDRNWSRTAAGEEMSTVRFVTGDFPETLISGGNADDLTGSQSVPMAARLRAIGVPVTSVFYEAGHDTALPHEYQFHLDYADARGMLDKTLAFLGRVAE